MKRFIVLAGDNFYPNGWSDYRGSYDSLEEAVCLAKSYLESESASWYEVVDSTTAEVVKRD